MTTLTFVVAGDPHQLTGGYLYGTRIVAALRERGWRVDVSGLAGRFPDVDAQARTALDGMLATLPDDALVIVDGLALAGLPDVVERHAPRLRLIALVHHPLADETGLEAPVRARLLAYESRAIAAARGVITTSHFTRARLRELGMHPERATVVEPGVVSVATARGSRGGPCQLLCVATLTPRKGHDILVDALAGVRELDWCCDCVGAIDRDRPHTAGIAQRIENAGLGERVRLRGPLPMHELAEAYASADLFVLASHYEGYGMAVSEALACGLPVVTTTGGALGHTLPDAAGRKVAPGDAAAFGIAIRELLTDRAARERARQGALTAREALRDWTSAAAEFAAVLDTYASGPP